MGSQLSSSPILFYSTAFGSLVGWDIRKPGDALRFEGDLRQGLTTAMCLGTDETWVASATSSGVVTVWDLRFRLRAPCQGARSSPRPWTSAGAAACSRAGQQ